MTKFIKKNAFINLKQSSESKIKKYWKKYEELFIWYTSLIIDILEAAKYMKTKSIDYFMRILNDKIHKYLCKLFLWYLKKTVAQKY